MSGLRYESFTVQGEPGEGDARAQQFVRAIDHGFLEPVRDEALEIAQLDRFRTQETLLSVAYDDDQDPRALDPGRPVATFGDFDGTLCVRPGVVVPTRMVTEVTVRTSHRRRGILRTLMTQCLQRCATDGYGLAALTASEDSIYGRFGFGRAAVSQKVSVAVEQGLRLRPDVQAVLDASGLRVFTPSWQAFPAVYTTAFEAFQARTPGQTGATHAYDARARGENNPWALKGESKDWRPLVVADADGDVHGYAIFTFDWPESGPRRAKIADLAADSLLAEVALWEALAATDLVQVLEWNEAPTDFALPVALVHPRAVSFEARADHVWIRITDMVAAFAARGLAEDGSLSLHVTDRLGLIDGDWVVTTKGAVTEVTAGAEPATAVGHEEVPAISLDAEALAELYLGTVDPATLVALGRAGVAPEHLSQVQSMFLVTQAPRNTYTF
jgi:predicted acetyltransferase